KILAIIIPENGAKVSKIKCFQFAQQAPLNKANRETTPNSNKPVKPPPKANAKADVNRINRSFMRES
ncbi:hypothetical protein, partial [Mediterraneibacter gnavus]|uniref:hypothetical protein n=1 Tax=Mediterraneibacter gnavus TaxID=33038 RepID=UPI001A9B05C0